MFNSAKNTDNNSGKRRPSLLLVIALGIWAFGLHIPICKAINTPWLTVEGNQVKDPYGNSVVFRGLNIIDPNWYIVRVNIDVETVIDKVTDESDGWFTRIIRIPVKPKSWHDIGPETYFNDYLKPAVEHCVERRIYCIVSWMYVSDYNLPEVDSATRAFWNYIAPRFASYSNVLYELFNEPVEPENWSTWKTIAQPWVDIIRSHASRNIIIVGSPHWSQFTRYAPGDPFEGSNLMYTCHVYSDFGYWGDAIWDEMFGNAAESVPVFVTEWGYEYPAPGEVYEGTTSVFGQGFKNYMENHPNISWTAWVYDYSWRPVMVDTEYNILGGENRMGAFTKQWLYEKRDSNLPGDFPDVDFNKDSKIDFLDYALMAQQWLQTPGSPFTDVAPEGGDNIIDILDLYIFSNYWLSIPPPPGDFNTSGTVNSFDLYILTSYWLWTGQPGQIRQDLNDDGTVDFRDFADFAQVWLE